MRHLTLLLLSVFTVYQAKVDILIPLDKYPTGEKRFNLQINGSHDTSTPWLSTTSFGVDERWADGKPGELDFRTNRRGQSLGKSTDSS